MAEIKDTEIRFIGDEKTYDPSESKASMPVTPKEGKECRDNDLGDGIEFKSSKREGCLNKGVIALVIALCGVALFVLGAVRSCASAPPDDPEDQYLRRAENEITLRIDEKESIPEGQFEEYDRQTDLGQNIGNDEFTTPNTSEALIEKKEIEVNGIQMNIFIPVNCVPSLHIGKVNASDRNILLAFQAADIRKDNGKIVGACVHQGTVVSEGLAKKGYVAMIDGQMSVGVAEHSPLFEAATQRGGDFFRQYPLVSDGAIVENNPKNISIRRGICQRGDQYFVAETKVPVSLHDFSQALVDMDVTNAVYLVGSQYACGFRRTETGEAESWGEEKFSKAKNISYIVWKKR